LQPVDKDRARIDDNNLRITVSNDQYHSTSVKEYSTGISQQFSASHRSMQAPSLNVQFSGTQSYKPTVTGPTQDRSAHLAHFQGSLPASQYGESYKQPQPVPPVKEIVQQTGRLLSQLDSWQPISLQPKHGTATTTSQPDTSQPLLVNISNSKYVNLDASSSLAQNLLKNINLLGRAFSSSTITYSPSDSLTATSVSSLPSASTSLFSGSIGYGDRACGSVASSKQEGSSVADLRSLKYRQPQTSSSSGHPSSSATASTCDPVIANVLKSIGFNFDMSKFGSTVVSKECEQSQASSRQYSSIASTPPYPVLPLQGNDTLQSRPSLAAPLHATGITTYDKPVEIKTFSEIDRVLQKVREHNKSKLRSRSPVKERVRSRSGHRSSPDSREDSRSAVKKSPRSVTKEKQRKQRNERREHAVEGSERHSGHEIRRDELRQRASPSPRRHDIRAETASRRKPYASRSPSLPRSREKFTSVSKKHKVAESAKRLEERAKRSEERPTSRHDELSRRTSLRRDTRVRKAVKRKSYSPQPPSSSPRHRLESDVFEHPSSAMFAAPVSYPPCGYPYYSTIPPPFSSSLPGTVENQKNPEDAEWEKSTEEFLRKLQEPSRPSAVSSARCYSPGVDSDLSSVSSGSIAEFIDDDVTDDFTKSSTSPQKPGCQSTVDKSMATADKLDNKVESMIDSSADGDASKSQDTVTSEIGKHPSSIDASSATSFSKMEKVCELY